MQDAVFHSLGRMHSPIIARSAVAETWRLKSDQTWESAKAGPDEQYLQAIAEIKKLVQEGDAQGAGTSPGSSRTNSPTGSAPIWTFSLTASCSTGTITTARP